MSSAETAETGSNILFHRDRHSYTANNRFTYLDRSLDQLYSLDSPKAVKHNRVDTSNARSVGSQTGQGPTQKRQKILPSKPFCLGLYQPNNPQNLETLSKEQSVCYEPPTSQLNQGIRAEWPKRGRTNARGRAPIFTQHKSPLRSQIYVYSDTMSYPHRDPSRNPPLLQAPATRSRSLSPAKTEQNRGVNADEEKQSRSPSPQEGKQSRNVSPDREKQSRSLSPKKEKQSRSVSPDKEKSVSPIKGIQSLRDDGMRDPPSDTHKYPLKIQEYLLELAELPDGFIPRSLEVYYKPSRPLTLLRLTCF